MTSIISPLQTKAVVEVVRNVMEKHFSVDKTLQFYFRDNKITNEFDRGTIAEISYDIIRSWRLLLEIDNNYPASKEIIYHKILGTWLIINNFETQSNPVFKQINISEIQAQLNQLIKVRKIKYSIPDWLDIKGFDAFGAEWENEIKSLNEKPPITLRTNRLKTKPNELVQLLKKEGYDCSLVDGAPDAIVLSERTNIFVSDYFIKGFFEVQDAGSQLISLYLDAQPGMRVCDACAGNGGKSLHLASIMQNRGKIIALDNQPIKLQTLKTRSAKAGCDIIETKLIDSSKTIKRLEKSFDRLLLDVPCSGTGSLRRNPELKWKNSPEKIENLKQIQSNILQKYPIMLRNGGIMVYATCSILPEENHDQVQNFLNLNSQTYELVKEQLISPANFGFDGFYMAQIRKK